MGTKNFVGFNESVRAIEDAHFVTVSSSWTLSYGGVYLGFKKHDCFVTIRRYSEFVDMDDTITILNSDFDTIARELGYVKQEAE